MRIKRFRSLVPVLLASVVGFTALTAQSQESPYIVTYDHYLEEPGDLEIGIANTNLRIPARASNHRD